MKLDDCRWQDSLEWQMRLWRWSQTPLAAKYLAHFPLATENARLSNDPVWRNMPGDALAAIMKFTMEEADPWWVSPDVAALIAEAAEDMPHDPLVTDDVPAPAGFVLVGGPPLLYPAAEDGAMTGKLLAMRAMSWRTQMAALPGEEPQPSLIVTHYAHIDDDDDFVDEVRNIQHVLRDYDAGNDLDPVGIVPLLYGDTSMWRTDEIAAYSGFSRWTVAFFRFVQQRVVGSEREYYGRALRREASRSGFERQASEGYVTAIRLRRIARPHEEGYEPVPTGRTLTTRHIRSGHWRRQWYPSIQLHRPIYIHTTVVGPDGAPLRLRKARGVIVNR
jgi:hypothetical protein